jgi:GT2 family glycosyltransferase
MIARPRNPLDRLARIMIRLPAAADPAVSLIVLLDGAAEMAERCLQAIAGADDDIPCETVVLLNDPDPALEKLVRGGTAGGKVVLCRANAGPGVGWNLGAAVARGPRLATLHEDSEPDAGWLAPLCETMTESGAGAVGSRLYNRDGTVQNCGWVLFSDASNRPIEEMGAPDVVAMSEPTPADMVSGAAMLLDREAVRAAGGWDERFHPAIFVDIDISTAIWHQGRPVLSVPASSVRHQSGAFDRRGNSPLTGPRLRTFLFERHRDRFLAKWGPSVRGLAPPPVDHEPETIRAAVQSALPHTRRRAEQVGTGSWKPPGRIQSAQRPYSGNSAPMLEQDDGAYAVAAEVEAALDASEREIVSDYCRWLVHREEEISDQLVELHERLHQRQLESAELHAHAVEVDRQRQELALALDRIANSNTWRLGQLIHRISQRTREAATRSALALRNRSRA